MQKVIVISGPTASGKTYLSVKLAKFFKGEIINADSVQIYQKFDIGASKISAAETQKIKHHLLGIIHPENCYNICDFQQNVRELIPSISLPFLVGGSGLYIKSALFDYELSNLKNFSKKTKLSNELTIDMMLKMIKQKDPFLSLDEKNPHRIISAYNHLTTSKLRSEKNGKNTPLFDILFFYLDIPVMVLKERVTLRLNNMLKQGLVKEVKSLMNDYPKANFNVIGYREIKFFLENKIDLQEAKDLIIRNTMKYAKRQKTWFKNQINSLVMLDALDEKLEHKTISIIQKFLTKDKKND